MLRGVLGRLRMKPARSRSAPQTLGQAGGPARRYRLFATWEHQRNASGARIKWMFTTDKARAKMGRLYPHPILGRQN
jgi:hypothetical protein